MPQDDGGVAFPSFEEIDHWDRDAERYRESIAPLGGMTLRDYFAGQVIAQCQISLTRGEDEPDPALVKAYAYRYAKTAYAIADAMLDERKK